jgi:putative membrane protein
MNPLSKRTGITNELAKERNRAAAERTLTAWIQNSLSLIGFGVAFDQIFEALQQTFPQENRILVLQLSHILGLSLIAIGVGLLILGIFQYRIEVQSIERENYITIPGHPLNIATSSAIILFGVATLIMIWF